MPPAPNSFKATTTSPEFGALSRVLGPIIAAFIWKATVESDGFFDYHTVFHICGVLMLFAVLMQLKLKLNYQNKIVEIY